MLKVSGLNTTYSVKCVGTINMRTLEGQAKLEFYPEYAKYELEMTPKAAPDDQDSMAPHSSGDVNQQMEHLHTVLSLICSDKLKFYNSRQ